MTPTAAFLSSPSPFCSLPPRIGCRGDHPGTVCFSEGRITRPFAAVLRPFLLHHSPVLDLSRSDSPRHPVVCQCVPVRLDQNVATFAPNGAPTATAAAVSRLMCQTVSFPSLFPARLPSAPFRRPDCLVTSFVSTDVASLLLSSAHLSHTLPRHPVGRAETPPPPSSFPASHTAHSAVSLGHDPLPQEAARPFDIRRLSCACRRHTAVSSLALNLLIRGRQKPASGKKFAESFLVQP